MQRISGAFGCTAKNRVKRAIGKADGGKLRKAEKGRKTLAKQVKRDGRKRTCGEDLKERAVNCAVLRIMGRAVRMMCV